MTLLPVAHGHRSKFKRGSGYAYGSFPMKLHEGRLFEDYPLYAEGLPRPACRGQLHLATLFVLPLGFYAILKQAQTSVTSTVAGIYMSAVMLNHFVSVALHRLQWSPVVENRLLKLEHATIHLVVSVKKSPFPVFPGSNALCGSNSL
jgi:hypothetical protein